MRKTNQYGETKVFGMLYKFVNSGVPIVEVCTGNYASAKSLSTDIRRAANEFHFGVVVTQRKGKVYIINPGRVETTTIW